MRLALALLVAAGCYNPSPPAGAPCTDDNGCPTGQACVAGFCGGSASSVDSSLADGTPQVSCANWNARHFDACAIPMAPGDLQLGVALSGYTFDTSNGTLKGKMNTSIPVTTMVLPQATGPDAMLLSVRDLELDAGATLTVTGSRPFVIAVWGTATIGGTIDASATLSIAGPGGNNTTECTDATGNNGASIQPALGGGGGGLQGSGGRGGNVGGMGGMSIGAPTGVRGGCAGGLGGAGSGTQAPRGAGGGAVQISARTSITVDGLINVGGGGGAGGRTGYGAGGGGGSGGFIGLDAPIVIVTGTLAANGGAGGGGASDIANGNNGGDARTTETPSSAGAGAGSSNVGTCANGGTGAAAMTLGGQNGGNSLCGGGGGGGAAGFVLVWSAMPNLGGTITPPALAGN
jgi:hypothetical protein